MAIFLRLLLQIPLAMLTVLCAHQLILLIQVGGKPSDFFTFGICILSFSGFIWTANLIGASEEKLKAVKSLFSSNKSLLIRHYRLIFTAIALIGLIGKLLSGSGPAAP